MEVLEGREDLFHNKDHAVLILELPCNVVLVQVTAFRPSKKQINNKNNEREIKEEKKERGEERRKEKKEMRRRK